MPINQGVTFLFKLLGYGALLPHHISKSENLVKKISNRSSVGEKPTSKNNNKLHFTDFIQPTRKSDKAEPTDAKKQSSAF